MTPVRAGGRKSGSDEMAGGEVATVSGALGAVRPALQGVPSGPLDARLLLAHVLGRSVSWLLAHSDHPLSSDQYEMFLRLIARRASGEPVAYLRGHVEWFGFDYYVTPKVLVPRPETELVLEKALELGRLGNARVVADVGTGSGVLAAELARGLPRARVFAIDLSQEALAVARRNAERRGVSGRITFLQGDLLEPLRDAPDLLVANLPYLSDSMLDNAAPDLKHEPRVALVAGRTGLELYRRLLCHLAARNWGPTLVLEIDPRLAGELAHDVAAVISGEVRVLRDYAGLERIIVYPGRVSATGSQDKVP